jgi:superfamily I DNA and RNA helicase
MATLTDKKLISFEGNHVRVHFAPREGDPATLTTCNIKNSEHDHVARQCETLIQSDGLLPQDILVLTLARERARQLANVIGVRIGPNLVRRPFDDEEKDSLAIQANRVTVSTIASAKGYDAPYVLLAALDDFPDDLEGRAALYVGCTRAREWLNVSASSPTPLVREFEASLAGTRGRS